MHTFKTILHPTDFSDSGNFNDLVTVYSVTNPVEAEVIKNALQSEGMPCMLEGAQQAGVAGTMALPINLQVRASDADRAAKFIRKHESMPV